MPGSAPIAGRRYAANGYARFRGAAILTTTFAAGEASALNGVLYSRAERLRSSKAWYAELAARTAPRSAHLLSLSGGARGGRPRRCPGRRRVT